jgi:hypothetical protein
MARKRYKPEEIVAKLRQADVLVSQGQFDVACHVTLRWGSFMQWRDDTTLPSRGL